MTSFPVPRYRIVLPPGSNENGKAIAAHWIVSQNGRITPGRTIVIIGGFSFPGSAMVRQWCPYENHHTEAYSGDPSDPDGVGWPIGVSPYQTDLCDGYIKGYVKGAGVETVVGGVLQPSDVERHEFPTDPTKRIMLEGNGADYRSVSRITHHWDPKIARTELWIGKKGSGPLQKYIDEAVPNMYTNEQLMSMYTGFYTDIRPNTGNEGLTFDFIFILPRMADDFASARVLVPKVAAEWGALSVDTTRGLVNGHLPPFDTVDSEDWEWPTELLSASPPVQVPIPTPLPVTYLVSQTVVDGKTVSGQVRWMAVTSDDARTSQVQFFVDGVDSMGRPEKTAPYGCTNVPGGDSDQGVFDTMKLSNGPHVFRATATRDDGLTVTATSTVVVNNPIAPVPAPKGLDVTAVKALNEAIRPKNPRIAAINDEFIKALS